MSLESAFQRILNNLKNDNNAFAKIALIGQPGAGKSSIINVLVGKHVAETGQNTDTTVEAKEYAYNFNKLVDLPGYGTKMFNMEEWRKKFNPEQYDIWMFVFSGKLMKEDSEMLRDLIQLNQEDEQHHPFLLVRNHSEDIVASEDFEDIRRDVYSKLPLDGQNIPLYFVDCRYKVGFKELAEEFQTINYRSIWEQKIIKNFRRKCSTVLSKCRLKAQVAIDSHKWAAAANGANPIPGVDIAADIGIYMDMFSDIRATYDIEQEDLDRFSVMPVVRKLIELATKNGILIMLKNYAGKAVMKNTLKFFPLLGNMGAAALGYKLCQLAGEDYIDDCNQAADKILQQMITEQLQAWEQEKGMLLLGGR